MRQAKKVIIVGAGPGGLAAAMLLAKAGTDVTVLERNDSVGGRTRTMEADGFRFDLGPTFFLYPEILRQIFSLCGRTLESEIDLIRLPLHYRLHFGDGTDLPISADHAEVKRAVADFSPDDAVRFDRYLEDNREKFESFTPILQKPFNGLGDVLRLPWHSLLPKVRPWSSVDSDLRNYFQDPRVRLAFTFQSKYLGMSPFKCPSLFTILSFLEHEYGVYHPRGGCGAVSEAMARVARELGAKIRLGEPVTAIDFDGKRARAVRTPNGRYDCDAMVINADFAQAMTTLVPDELRSRWTDKKLSRKKYSCSTFMMYLGLDGTVPNLDHHSIFLARDYEGNLDDIENRHRLSEDPSFYVQNPAVTDPGMAPEGGSSLYVLVPVTHMHDNVDWNREKAPFRAKMLRRLESIGIPDIESRIRYERILTPADWQGRMHLYRGATFSLAHNLGQSLHLRPRNRFEDLESVYLVGGGTHPGSGLPVIFQSARMATELITDDFDISPTWEQDAESRPSSSSLALQEA